MNDKNFNSLKHLKTPESWIDNALSIPNKKAPQPAFFIRYSRQLVAAACLVLVCAVSLFVILQKDDEKILVIDPDFNITHTDSLSETETNGVTNIDENGTSASTTESKKQNGDAPFESSENTNSTENTKATQKPTRPKGDKEENQDKTEKPTSKPVAPTDTQTDAPEKPTDYEEDIYPTEGDVFDDPMMPGMPPQSTESSGAPAEYIDFGYIIDSSLLYPSERVLMTITDPSGSVIIKDKVGTVLSDAYNDYAYFYIPTYNLKPSVSYYFEIYSSSGKYLGSGYFRI